jgi:hypothetical protein
MMPYLSPVKKAIAVLLVSIYTVSFSELPQLLKIPILVQHFLEHKQQDPKTTFWAFIKEHYQGKFEMDADYKRDNQLPFRTANFISNTIVIFDPPDPIEIPVSVPALKQEFTLFNDDNNPVSSFQDIFQPPRFLI